MKHLLLIVFIFFCATQVRAQLDPVTGGIFLLQTGVKMAAAGGKDKAGKGEANVSSFSHEGTRVPLKRVPAQQVKGEHREVILAVEQGLNQAKALYDARQLDQLEAYTATFPDLTTKVQLLEQQRPKWNVAPYKAEMAFYTGLAEKQKTFRLAAAKAAEEARAAAERARLAREAEVETKRAEAARMAAAAAAAAMASDEVQETPVTEDAAPAAVVPVKSKPAAKTPAKTTTKRTTTTSVKKGATVYYCASGNTVKYHRSSSCRGLNRCSASVDPISLKEAQSYMDACKICN
ncbi:hypothetical protein [Pontibacter fetidus]|uniref:Uncharacterized protein n=1 Tax=Pontibacter fetidus TaxID=2700082 RepID=A0A6B2HC81_9BACT|nr:hypothetical protein [Pontibacter fetidus]NDK57374.1 hypothetical protein [Pontibacter fetidus]